ncbi:unnamed protein product [Rhodiola kirilowii]
MMSWNVRGLTRIWIVHKLQVRTSSSELLLLFNT